MRTKFSVIKHFIKFSHELHELSRITVLIFKKFVKIRVIRGEKTKFD